MLGLRAILASKLYLYDSYVCHGQEPVKNSQIYDVTNSKAVATNIHPKKIIGIYKSFFFNGLSLINLEKHRIKAKAPKP